MYQRVGPKAFKKNLDNIITLTNALDKPQDKFPSIHIAGTNGKGSTGFILAAILQAQGFKTGLYVSPHYKTFRERIRINGKYVPKKFVVDFVEKNKSQFDKIKPSFFEISVAMAFAYFAEQKVDIAIIETGLGGRLDSTNILAQPLLSIITNISLDHQNFLGDTLPLIAKEKAGIIKKNVPIIIGESHPETKSIFEKIANQKNASITFADQHFAFTEINHNLEHTFYKISKDNITQYDKVAVNLHGTFQHQNLQTALQSIAVLNQKYPRFQVSPEAMQKGLFNLKKLTRYIGRWQILQNKPMVLCDSAHNEAGLKAVSTQLQALSYSKLHCVLGFVNDKDVTKALSFFPKQAKYYFAKANIPRGLDAQKLKAIAAESDLKGRAYVSIKNALNAAKRAADEEDLIFVGGSVFTVAEVL